VVFYLGLELEKCYCVAEWNKKIDKFINLFNLLTSFIIYKGIG
jgi:hypothetical protein